MACSPEFGDVEPVARQGVLIKVFGVGTAGMNVLDQLSARNLSALSYSAINTDQAALAKSSIAEKIHVDTKVMRGLGTGGDPDRGAAAARDNEDKLKSACAGASVIFILAGLGGGAGGGISPVLAEIAKQSGALVLGFVTMPFDCEGRHRQKLAQHSLSVLKAAADGVICLPNQKVCKLIDENTSVTDTFKITNELLADGLCGVWRLLTQPGLIEIHFGSVCEVFRNRHAESTFAVAEARGSTRSREVMEKLLAHPMLEGSEKLAESETVLISLTGGPDLTMAEINRIMEQMQRQCEHAQVIMGAGISEDYRERIAITLIASSKHQDEREESPEAGSGSRTTEDLDTQLITRSTSIRTSSRFVPPAPTLPPEQVEQLLKRQGAGRARKSASKLRQGQLPLEIVSKGRFDKSEPTIHRGEDLDVPTYIRRGMALN